MDMVLNVSWQSYLSPRKVWVTFVLIQIPVNMMLWQHADSALSIVRKMTLGFDVFRARRYSALCLATLPTFGSNQATTAAGKREAITVS